MDRRRIIIIVAIAIFIGIGAALFVLGARNKKQSEPVVNVPQIKKVLSESVISPVGSYDNSSIWYFNSNGRLYRVNTDGSGLSEFSLPELSGSLKYSLWPPNGSDFIAIVNSGQNDRKVFYNSKQKIYVYLPNNIRWLDWMSDGVRVAYIWQTDDGKKQMLVTANADGTGFRTIAEVYWPDLAVKVSADGSKALLYRTIADEVNKIYLADIDTGGISTVIGEGKNTQAMWVDSGRFIYAQNQPTGFPKLFMYDLNTQGSVDLGLITSVDKIALDKDRKFLYAAVPNAQNSGDNFVKLDLASLKQENYFESDQKLRAFNLTILGNTLYFVNSSDGNLFVVNK